MPRVLSVFVTTYNAPRELDLVLCGLARQTVAPDEILVADDGSTDETKGVVEAWRERLAAPVQHVWQPDDGFRKEAIANEAVRHSQGDHLVFLDGDSIPHRCWLADHAQAADGHRVLCGRRVKLGPEISGRVTREWVSDGRLEALFGPVLLDRFRNGTRRVFLGVRLPQIVARCLHPRARKLMGVNFSLPRAAFLEVNGYDEEIEMKGREDLDLGLRLKRAGRAFYPLLNRAVVYHLHHREREVNDERMRTWRAEQERATHVRCALGLDRS